MGEENVLGAIAGVGVIVAMLSLAYCIGRVDGEKQEFDRWVAEKKREWSNGR